MNFLVVVIFPLVFWLFSILYFVSHQAGLFPLLDFKRTGFKTMSEMMSAVWLELAYMTLQCSQQALCPNSIVEFELVQWGFATGTDESWLPLLRAIWPSYSSAGNQAEAPRVILACSWLTMDYIAWWGRCLQNILTKNDLLDSWDLHTRQFRNEDFCSFRY